MNLVSGFGWVHKSDRRISTAHSVKQKFCNDPSDMFKIALLSSVALIASVASTKGGEQYLTECMKMMKPLAEWLGIPDEAVKAGCVKNWNKHYGIDGDSAYLQSLSNLEVSPMEEASSEHNDQQLTVASLNDQNKPQFRIASLNGANEDK
ncbi:unnamed protein product, partial [Anisakis simplex]|uniref:Polyprotein n=1 Tax=Anisakis simplex TaxID=6269 RepID=A0A0M3KFK9_ANISI